MLRHYQIIIDEKEKQLKNYEAPTAQKKKASLPLSYDRFDLRWSLSQIRPIVR
jgi:hypothetical protein